MQTNYMTTISQRNPKKIPRNVINLTKKSKSHLNSKTFTEKSNVFPEDSNFFENQIFFCKNPFFSLKIYVCLSKSPISFLLPKIHTFTKNCDFLNMEIFFYKFNKITKNHDFSTTIKSDLFIRKNSSRKS